MFGQGGSNFGSQGNTFGQSAFGAAKPSTFGAPTFGTSAPSGTSSLFGAAPQQPTTNLFGSTATPFGQAQNTGFGTTTPSTGFGFGTGTSAPATGTSMFGGTPSIFGTTQQQQQTPASTGSIFGTQTSFGNKPAFGSFGTSSGSIFGQTSQPSTTSSIFGQQQASTATGGLFGTGTSTFGGGLGATPGQVGTGAVKFKAIQGTDTVSKNNTTQTVQVRHQVITCQPEYEAKSFEELRFEDYQANRKGPGQGGAMFGTTATPGLFGASTTTQPSTGGLFGQQQRSIFGSTQTATPALGSSTGIFGQQPQQQQQTSLFGAKTFGVPTTTASGFSFPSAATSSAGGGLFGAKPFGTPAPSTGVFSGAPTTSAPSFGSTTGGFGSQTTSPFGAKPSIFGATTTTSSFFSSPVKSQVLPRALFSTNACGNNQNRSTTLEVAAESTLEELAIGQDRIENPASAVKNTSMSSTTLVSTTSQLSQEEKCPEEDGPYAVHIPHDSNCTMFYKCFKGTPVLQLCPSGLWFNAVLEVCDYPEQSGCVMGKSSS